MVGHALVLTASLFTGQTTDYQVVSTPQKDCNCNKGGSGPVIPIARSQPRPPLFSSGNRPILNKIGGIFGGNKQNQDNGAEVVPDYYRRMPTSNSTPIITSEPPVGEKIIQPASMPTNNLKPINHQSVEPGVAPKKNSPLLPQFANKVGHETDYSWVTGQLQQENGQWVVYYATPDTIEKFGGSMVLQPAGEIRGAQNGDLVSVHGSVVQSQGGRPVYRATRIDLIERTK